MISLPGPAWRRESKSFPGHRQIWLGKRTKAVLALYSVGSTCFRVGKLPLTRTVYSLDWSVQSPSNWGQCGRHRPQFPRLGPSRIHWSQSLALPSSRRTRPRVRLREIIGGSFSGDGEGWGFAPSPIGPGPPKAQARRGDKTGSDVGERSRSRLHSPAPAIQRYKNTKQYTIANSPPLSSGKNPLGACAMK